MQTTVQRIGRVLRRPLGEDDPHDRSLIFMFADPNYKLLEDQIRTEIEHEIDLSKKKKEREGREGGSGSRKAEAIGIEGGSIDTVKSHGIEETYKDISSELDWLASQGIEATLENAHLALQVKKRERQATSGNGPK